MRSRTTARGNRLLRLELLLWAGGVAFATVFTLGWIERNAFQLWYSTPAPVREEIIGELPDDLRPIVPPAKTGTVLGRIEMADAGVSAVFVEGVDAKSLSRAVGHVPGSALPGERGRVALAAHRDTFFRGLRTVREKDRIRLEADDKSWEYEVTGTEIVTPDRTDVIGPSKDALLTLVTCYPFDFVGKAPKRFIVHARLVPTVTAATVDGCCR